MNRRRFVGRISGIVAAGAITLGVKTSPAVYPGCFKAIGQNIGPEHAPAINAADTLILRDCNVSLPECLRLTQKHVEITGCSFTAPVSGKTVPRGGTMLIRNCTLVANRRTA